MLHFCSVEDIKNIIPSASRFDALYEQVRQAVTDDFNRYMRRELDYAASVVEILDLPQVAVGGVSKVYLYKKNVTSGGLTVHADYTRSFTDDYALESDRYSLDPARGVLFLVGPFDYALRALRVAYAGGYAANVVSNVATDTMACPAALVTAALDECKYRIDKTINNKQGDSQETSRKNATVNREALVDGLLPSSARALQPFRRPLGTVLV